MIGINTQLKQKVVVDILYPFDIGTKAIRRLLGRTCDVGIKKSASYSMLREVINQERRIVPGRYESLPHPEGA